MLTYLLSLAAIMGAAGMVAALVSRWLKVPRVTVLLLAGLLLGNVPLLSRLYDVGPLQDQLGPIVQVALIVVLYYGGLSVDVPSLRDVLGPAIRLATVGALGTALLVGLALYGLHAAGWVALPGFGLLLALTFGALIAPNDPIAVFSAIDSQSASGGTGRAETIAKIESGFDDTVVTTLVIMILIPMLQSGEDVLARVGPAALQLVWLVTSAVVLGAAVGWGAAWLHRRLPLEPAGQVLLSLALAALLFLLASVVSSSGYVAVFVLGLALSRRLPQQQPAVYRPLHAAWGMAFRLCEVFAFVTLGALARLDVLLSTVWAPAVAAIVTIVLVARPLQVVTCTAGTGLTWAQKAYVASVAMKGLDPAVLAIAVVAAVGRFDYLIDLTFAVVIGVTVVQGLILMGLSRLGLLQWPASG